MIRTMMVLFFLAAVLPCAAQESLSPTDHLGGLAFYADEAECLQAAKDSKGDAAGLFRAGRYLMATVYSGLATGGLEKRKAFDLCRKAYGFFESALRLEPADALLTAWAGSARLLSCAYGSTFDAIQNGGKGVAAFKSAIRLDSENPDLRLLRARAYAYLPRAYYPDCDDTILDDCGIVIGQSQAPGAVLDEAFCYRCIALKQMGKPDEAAQALSRIDSDSRFAAIARDWKKR